MKLKKTIFLDKNIHQLMRKYNFSVSDLARLSGVHKSSLHNWANGTLPKGLEPLVKLSRYFDISLDELVFQIYKADNRGKQQVVIEEGSFEITVKKIQAK